jgi:hypothetical protein
MTLPLVSTALIIVLMVVVLFDKLEREANERLLTRLKAGEYLVRWTYSKQEWQNFTKNEARRSPWVAFDHLLYAVPILAVATIVTMLLKLKPSDTRTIIGIIVGSTIFMVFVALIRFVDSGLQHKRRLRGSDTVYFTLQGVFQDGALATLPNLNLPKILPGNPSVLHLEGSRAYGNRSTPYTVRVAIPEGKENEAQTLVRFYQAQDAQERETLLHNLNAGQASLWPAPVADAPVVFEIRRS